MLSHFYFHWLWGYWQILVSVDLHDQSCYLAGIVQIFIRYIGQQIYWLILCNLIGEILILCIEHIYIVVYEHRIAQVSPHLTVAYIWPLIMSFLALHIGMVNTTNGKIKLNLVKGKLTMMIIFIFLYIL